MSERVVCVRDDWTSSPHFLGLELSARIFLPKKGERCHVRAAMACVFCGDGLAKLEEQPGPFCYDADFFRPEADDGEAELERLRGIAAAPPADEERAPRRERETVGEAALALIRRHSPSKTGVFRRPMAPRSPARAGEGVHGAGGFRLPASDCWILPMRQPVGSWRRRGGGTEGFSALSLFVAVGLAGLVAAAVWSLCWLALLAEWAGWR
jgi:hypothetical protein